VWKFGFAVSKSKRQLNDWYQKKKNQRSRLLHTQITGKSGVIPIIRGFDCVLRMRWQLEPGDAVYIDSTSARRHTQFRAFLRWLPRHPDWEADCFNKIFWWHRPPYAGDPLYKMGKIIPVVPEDPLAPLVSEQYFQSFLFHPYPGVLEDMLQSKTETKNQ